MFQTAMFLDAFDYLCTEQYRRMKEKGFWGPIHSAGVVLPELIGTPVNPPNIGEKLMLMVTELAELFEAHRKGVADKPCNKHCTIIDPKATKPIIMSCTQCDGKGTIQNERAESVNCAHCGGKGAKEQTGYRRLTNEEEELADVVIRVADYCGYKGIDLGRAILAKMAYNTKRPHMHGKTC